MKPLLKAALLINLTYFKIYSEKIYEHLDSSPGLLGGKQVPMLSTELWTPLGSGLIVLLFLY